MPLESEQPRIPASRNGELERLKTLRWPTAGRAERVAKAMRALKGPRPTFSLSPDEWKTVAEDPTLEEG